MSFSQLGLNDRLLKGIRVTGFSKPTPIQLRAIPIALTGRDIIGLAQTGTGKTAAFVLPMLHRFDNAGKKRGIIRGLILTPTRELAQQVKESISMVGRFTNYSSLSVYGGVSMDNQLRNLRRGVDVVVATPGRLLDHLDRGTIDLSHVEVLVLDEADRMFDMGFIDDVIKIISYIPKERQTFLFSATMPDSIQKLTASIQKNPEIIRIGKQTNPAELIKHYFFKVSQERKLDLLVHMLNTDSMKSVLVFSRTRRGADKLCKKLVQRGFKAIAIHSDRTQSQRQNALTAFKNGRYRVLVATDVAARGIDVEGISHVVNYDTPVYAQDYIHRVGRTGRAELTGDAVTFVAAQERKYFNSIQKLIGKRFPIDSYPGFVYLAESIVTDHDDTNQRRKIDKPRNGQVKRNGKKDIPLSYRGYGKKKKVIKTSGRKKTITPAGVETVGIQHERKSHRAKSKHTSDKLQTGTVSVTSKQSKYDWRGLMEAGEKLLNKVRGKA